jgi:hypothetical protein
LFDLRELLVASSIILSIMPMFYVITQCGAVWWGLFPAISTALARWWQPLPCWECWPVDFMMVLGDWRHFAWIQTHLVSLPHFIPVSKRGGLVGCANTPCDAQPNLSPCAVRPPLWCAACVLIPPERRKRQPGRHRSDPVLLFVWRPSWRCANVALTQHGH